MSNRRDLDRSHGGHEHSGAETANDPWAALGPASGESDRGVADDFWGDVPDWSGQASTSRRTGRGRIGSDTDELVDPTPIGTPVQRTGLAATLGRAWDQLLGGGGESSREHRRIDAAEPRPVDPFDDLDEYAGYDTVGATRPPEVDTEPAAERPGIDDQQPRARTPIDHVEQQWVAEAAAASERPAPIDPLLTRLGALIIVTALVVPLLLSITSSGDGADAEGSVASADAADTVTVPAPTLLSNDASTAAPTSTVVDPASLPPAIPVDTEAPSASSAPSDSSSDDDGTDTAPATDQSDSPVSASAASTDDSAIDAVESPAAADESAARVDPPVCPIPYTVVEGDFWLRLADAANVDLADLLEVNRSTVNTPLFPGGEICLPEGATTPAPPVTTTQAPATTVAPTTAPPTTQAPATEPPGPDDIKQIIRDVWPDDLEDRALEIAYRESRFVPTAKNFCCYGLFQIYWEVHDVWLDDIGITSASQLYDPETNARAAYALYQRAGGWGPWQL